LKLIPEEQKITSAPIIAPKIFHEPALKKGQTVNIEDFMVQSVRKEAKRANLFNVSSNQITYFIDCNNDGTQTVNCT
jgi:hypothetical protein